MSLGVFDPESEPESRTEPAPELLVLCAEEESSWPYLFIL